MVEPNRRLLVSQDWFFSHLFREMLTEFFSKKLGGVVPPQIHERFTSHDSTNQYRGFAEAKRHGNTQTGENPQSQDVTPTTELSEPEVGYNISIMN